jgi:DNA-binding NarL/FixJ family response regulator
MALARAKQVIRVLIADESRISCQSLKAFLQKSCKSARIAGSAVNQEELLKILGTDAIDVALIGDGFMGGAEIGGHTLRSIHHQFPQTKLVALLKRSDATSVVFAFGSGVRGIFDQSEKLPSLCKCIQAVHNGQIWANSQDIQHLIEDLTTLARRKSRS